MEQEKKNEKKFLLTGVLAVIGIIAIALFAGIMLRQTQENRLGIGASDSYRVENNDEAQAVKGKVIVKYLDESGEEIMNSDTLEGNVGTEYTTTRKQKDHYISNGHEPLNKIGEYSEDDIIVKYFYKQVKDVFSVDQEDDIVTLKVQNLKQYTEYKLILEQESITGDKLTGGRFYLDDNSNPEGRITATTIQGRALLGAINVSDEEDNDLILSEIEAPNGYEFALSNGAAGIHLDKSYNAQTDKYELVATSQDAEVEVVQDDENLEVILKVKNKPREGYEIATKQFVKSVDGVDTNRNVEAGISRRGKIEYTEEGETVTVKTGEVLKYKIRVYNEENQDIDGQVVTQVLPDGLKYVNSTFNQNQGWSLNEGNLTSNKLVGTTIAGVNPSTDTEVKYGELELELIVDENEVEENTTSLTNTASVPIDRRERNRANNSDDETVNLTSTEDVYDLAIYKFATKINNNSTTRSVTAKLNEYSQLEYDVVDDESTIKDLDTIIYTIRVYNEGNKDLNGTKVTDVLPAGLQFVQNSTINTQNGWTVNGNNVETTILENKTIEGFLAYRGELPKYEELQIELKLDEDAVGENTDTIVNKVTLAAAENETDLLDNEEEDELALARTPKTYDIALKKFASTIDEGDTSRRVNVSVNANNQAVYEELNAEKTVEHGQKIVYTIRVYNEGNTTATLKKITDTVPTGLKFVEYEEGDNSINATYGWTKNGNNIETNFLNGQTIQGTNYKRGETPRYLEVKVEFEVDEAVIPDGVTTIVNNASIEAIDNETDVADNQDDDTVNVLRREKIYNFVLKKYASKIDNVDTGRGVVASIENNKFKYTTTKPEKTVNDGQTVRYTLRVYNDGNQNLIGTKITETLPEGMEFVDSDFNKVENNWTLTNGILESTKILGTEIQGSRAENNELPKYVDIYLDLKVNRTGLGKAARTLTNTATLAKNENETIITDNVDSDSLNLEKIPVYDLLVKKIASEVDGTATGRTVNVTMNENNELVYTKVETDTKVEDEQVITYTFRIFNNGETAITGTKITEQIPQGLKYLENEFNAQKGWTKEEETITNESIVGTTINPYDKTNPNSVNYVDIKVQFEVVEDEVPQTDLITNTVKIDKNDQEDDKDNEGQEGDNNTDTEIVGLNRKLKTHDITVKKFVDSINGAKQNKEVTAKVNAQRQIVYTNDDIKTNVNLNDIVVFTIRMFNTGNQPMVGKTVTDTIPEGLEFIEDNQTNIDFGWQVENGVATTNYIVGQTIEGFEKTNNAEPNYVDVQIVCKVTGTNRRANDELENIGRMEPDETDDNPDDNEDRVTVVLIPEKQKVSDLSMQKFLYSVDGKVLTDREIVAKNINGKIVYTKNDEVYKVSNNQKLVYTLRVYNVGDGETLGRIVVEDLPKGLDFVKDSEINTANNWKMYKQDKNGEYVETEDAKEATLLKSDKLTTETINGFEVENNQTPQYKDILVELIVNENEVETTDRIVTNNANLVKDPEEPDNGNDKSSEKVQVKMFDLNVTKYIKDITIVNSDGEDKTVVGIDKKGKIVKKEVHAKKVDETQVFVTYGLKVDNFGEIAGYATQLTDYVPENFELESSDAIWTINKGKITTDILADKLIQPGESKTVEVTFKWTLKGTELGERNNIAYITDSTNDYKAKDRIPDRDNEEKFIISIKTGKTETYIAFIIGGLTIIALLIVIKLKMKKGENNEK